MKTIQKKAAGNKNQDMIQHAEDVGAACRMAALNLEATDCVIGGTKKTNGKIWTLRKQAARKVEELQELVECIIIRLENLK